MSERDGGNVFNYYKVYVALGVTVFSVINFLTRFILPNNATRTFQQKWKWRNVATSLMHSIITGIWAPVAFFQAPEMCDDLIRTFTDSTHLMVSVSTGYFVYDSLDMLLYHRKRSTYELMIHHILVILCFGISVSYRQYVAYAAVSLVVEINSVFLHTRQLFIITGEPKSSTRYKVNALLNVATFLFFRILLLGWMTRWLTVHRDEIPFAFFTIGSVGLAVIVTMNIVLFCRILSVDLPSFVRFGQNVERKETSRELWNGYAENKSCSEQNGNVAKNGNVVKNGNIGKNGSVVNGLVHSLFEEESVNKND